ncbi:MAG: DUF4388 domain-containing protein [bacterium]|nr:DUF4388 domain-containing protein [bacterium]
MADPNSKVEAAHIVVYSDSTDRDYALKVRLGKEGYQITHVRALDVLVAQCRRLRPQVVLIRSLAIPRDVVKIIRQLKNLGMDFARFPTFLVLRGHVARSLMPLLAIGLEDIIDLDDGMEILVQRIKEVEKRGSTEQGRANETRSGSRGNLSEMSIIDLVQALGPSQRTAKITVSSNRGGEDKLVMFLNRGNISFAKLGELVAEKAIYEALAWENGTWLLEPITESDLPEANNNLPNDFILMEGCRLIDERSREGKMSGAQGS